MSFGLWRAWMVGVMLVSAGAATIGAQSLEATPGFDPENLRGGSFLIDGREIKVAADQITRHFEFIKRLNPKSGARRQLEIAWARAIRVEAARAWGLGTDQSEFSAWMAETHAAHRDTWAPQGKLDPKLLEVWIKARGFESVASYEEYVYEEFLGELFADREFGGKTSSEEDLRQRFEELTTNYRITVLALAPETLEATERYEPSNLESSATYQQWFAGLNPGRQRSFDDQDRPAIACEAIYCDFGSFDPAGLRAYFEAPRPSARKSLAKRCEGFEPNDLDLNKIFRRWDQFRFSHLARLNATLPSKLDNVQSFALVKEHLVREWKITCYLAQLRTEIDAGPRPIKLKAWAESVGLPYVKLDLRPIAQHVNHPTFRGTHYYGLRRAKAGELYASGDHLANEQSLYYVNGVVEQPGYHASIWKLIEFQDMRQRPADEVKLRAWPEFIRELRWVDSQVAYRKLDSEFEAAMAAKIKTAHDNQKTLMRPAAKGLVFSDLATKSKNLELVTPLFIRPTGGMTPSVNSNAILGIRLQNALNRDGVALLPSGRRLFKVGDILGPALSPGYRVGFVARVDQVIPPAPARFKVDHRVRRNARESLRLEALRNKLARARTASRWPVLKRRYQLKAPDLATATGEKK